MEIFLHNKLQDISIAKYCQAQPSPSLAGLSSHISKTRVLNKVRIFDRIQSKDSDSIRFEKMGSCAALVQGQGNVKGGSRQGQSKVKERSREGQGKVKATQAQPQLQFDGF